jgi:hypothetical protein
MANGTGTVDEIRPQTVLAHTSQFAVHYNSKKVPFIESPSTAALSQRQSTPDGTSRENRRALNLKETPCIISRNTVIAEL